jgi:hypothetical protein
MPDRTDRWQLEGFLECVDRWTDLEHPSDDLRLVVTAWILSRFDDPYRSARREPGFDNLWFALVPGTLEPDGSVVACSFWIEELSQTVRCDSFASLGYPT